MREKRIIPCLDVKNGRVVKGVKFENLRDAGDPAEIACLYDQQGADEIVLLDITATCEKRKTITEVIKKVARELSVPLTVGGGIRTIDDIREILIAGADKVGINSAAVADSSLIGRAAELFGSRCVVIAIDVKSSPGGYTVYVEGGRRDTGIDAVQWAMEAERLGAGEILLTSMDRDGTKNGYDIDITGKIAGAVKIPVIASGGAGKPEHFYDVFTLAHADAALGATVFHYRELSIYEVKKYLKENGTRVKL